MMQPKIFTFNQLIGSLMWLFNPLTPQQRKSALLDLHDLWTMGAPTPDCGPGVVEKRILLPNQFAEWWLAMARKHGYSDEIMFTGNGFTPREG